MKEEKTITSMTEEKRVFNPPEELSKGIFIGFQRLPHVFVALTDPGFECGQVDIEIHG